MAIGKHIFRGTVEVPNAKTDKEAVNYGQMKNFVNRYMKESVKVATTAELSGTYLDGVYTLNTDIHEIDGVTLDVNDSILVKDEINKEYNGAYIVTDLGTTGTPSNATGSTTSATITKVNVDKTVFETKTGANTDKSYVFTYSASDTAWKDDTTTPVTLADYGISIEGTETDADTITVAYKAKVNGTGGVIKRREDFAEGKIILNNTFVNVMEGQDNGDTRWTIVSNGVLTVGTSEFIFVKDIDTEQSSIKVAKVTVTPDGVNKVFNISHNFHLQDEYGYILKILDNAHNEVYVDNTPKLGNENDAITLSFESIPAVTETFKVYILGLE